MVLSTRILSIFCIGGAPRDTSQKILGETRWDGTKITRKDRSVSKLSDAEMQKLKDEQKRKQDEKDKCFREAVNKKKDRQAQLSRETPPISSLLTGEDTAIAGTSGAITAGAALYNGATATAAAGAGISSAGLSIVATLAVRGAFQTVNTALANDEIINQYNKEYKDCEKTHGPSSWPVRLNS